MFGERCYKFCLPRMSPQNEKRNKTKSNTKKKKVISLFQRRERKRNFKSKTDIPLPFLWYTVFSSQKKLDSNNNFTLLVKG